jgi:hypothetical protein
MTPLSISIRKDFTISLHGFFDVAPANDWAGSLLIHKTVSLPKYAYYKHIGPYSELKTTYKAAREEFKKAGIQTGLPSIEIYGHWTNDPSKLETEVLWSIL